MESNNQITELCKLGYKYGTDKCPQIKHSYTPFYYKLLKDKRQSVRKVLEIGIGKTRRNLHRPEKIYENGVKRFLHRGASLRMWRDFFPNAQIYGADITPETMFAEERIKTYLCDERKKEDLVRLIHQTGSDIDVVVDDASQIRFGECFGTPGRQGQERIRPTTGGPRGLLRRPGPGLCRFSRAASGPGSGAAAP